MSKQTKTAAQNTKTRQVVAVNRRARHDYEIGETYEAGIALVGTEVKSLRAGRVNFQDAFCKIEHGEAWLYNMHISPYEQGNRYNTDPKRPRKLLLHRYEIERLRAAAEQKGLTIIPLSIFFERGFAKVEIALARGKKLYDKRESIAERDREREALRQAAGRE
ncbi:MAG TPA: SsrA-binding protein SmpB [Chthonomonas sp.]|uniref:SsrA-binding protein SmpB n=1 Tax=Chthonomonas sp. TaxID=2282153 RepID=UPI002B4B4F3F|nr:SsrA-binding protein SmpB [Chthonomonas sp.]HLI47092.1 SsrA-binding protein SmpB [Chthonomonas sp.]